MHDLKEVRTKPDYYRERLSKRDKNLTGVLDEVLLLDQKKREIQTKADELRKRKNEIAQEISRSKDDEQKTEKLKSESISISSTLANIEKEEINLSFKFSEKVLQLPNITSDDVPEGEDETKNKEILKWGNPKTEKWIKPHDEIGLKLGIFDFERGVKIAQSRFTVLLGIGAKLERALMNFMLDHAATKGYKEIFPPILVNKESMIGTGQLPKFEGDFYKCEGEFLYLVPTAEVPITNLHRDEILSPEQLPLKYCAYTPCFRREAGAASKDTRGIIRQHQFNKVELVKITTSEQSVEEHEKLTNDAEEILKKLELPYRKILLCTGDTGFSAMKCYDLEVWFPAQNKYREISSCSNFGAFQARRINIKYKPNQKDKPVFAHTINGSGLAIGRTLAAILENYQTEKGTVTVPKLLQCYLGELKEIIL
ncbi:MAG: serine--tRNA ligase [Candidatus Melainabacteria bacterium RIFCSPHIGHO2_02_FULL_34_12]|nr:MAG: serine--tRNA ligase [Candidatus Melainabacteria bacterium RIFCSPHIGHO2_02_FULL_34_12]